MKIKSATVLVTRHGTDTVILDTDYPCPFVLGALPSQPPLQVEFRATKNTGAEYIRRNFGLEPKIIEV